VLSRRIKLTGRQMASFSVNSAAITPGARNWQQLLLGLSLREKYIQYVVVVLDVYQAIRFQSLSKASCLQVHFSLKTAIRFSQGTEQ